MRPICMGPELALPATFAATLSREAACRREETTANIAPSDRDDGPSTVGSKGAVPFADGIAPVEVG